MIRNDNDDSDLICLSGLWSWITVATYFCKVPNLGRGRGWVTQSFFTDL